MLIKGFASGLRALRMGIVLFAALLLVNCGGGGSSSPPPVPPADPTGYYDFNGSATLKIGGGGSDITINNVAAIVQNNRILMFDAAGEEFFDIQVTSINGNSFTGMAKITYINIVQRTTTSSVSGTITQGTRIDGTLTDTVPGTGQGFGDGTFTLTYNNQMGTLPSASSNWGLPILFSSTDYIFNTDGAGAISTNTAVTDGLLVGCIIDTASPHTMTEIGSSGLYAVSFSITGCTTTLDTTYDGTYTGFAVVEDASASTLALAVARDDGLHSISGSFTFQ